MDPSPTEPKIALVVATYRRPEALATLLASLGRQTLTRSEFEVAVVIDGVDETEAAYRQILERARSETGLPVQWTFQANAGQSVARDRGIGSTRARWIVVVDDDMDLAPGFLAAHLEALESGGARPVAIGRVVPEEGWERGPLHEAMRTLSMLDLHDEIGRGQRLSMGKAFVTQNVSFGRDLYRSVGGFDEALRLGEDTELGWQFERAGARFVFADRAAAVHRSRVGSFDTWLRRQVEYGRSGIYIYQKLGRDPQFHFLRNLANGSRLNALLVSALCRSDATARGGIALLRWLGEGLQRLGLMRPAVATHKAIQSLAYHLGVRRTLGSWSRLQQEKRSFLAAMDRPLGPA
jgi:GT2 family glycosyltransferase